jgi:hypothetical protein
LPDNTVDDILALPFEAPSLDGVSGKRELHNNTRRYFEVDNRKHFPVCEAVAQAFQDKRVTSHIEKVFGTDLKGTYLRMEFAQDPRHQDLGTDIYDVTKNRVGRSPFAPNAAMIFVPADNTSTVSRKRSIKGVRTSLIINYVTDEWRAREQLAFPEAPIA